MKKKENSSTKQLKQSTEIEKKLKNNPDFRKGLALDNLYWFVRIYFPHYLKCRTAPFQMKIYKALENLDKYKFLELLAFRESAKSTITSLFYPVWEIVRDRYHFILLSSFTGSQVKQLFQNIKLELEQNEQLIKDFGPFVSSDEWTAKSMIIPEYDVKVVGKSVGGSVRGIRYKEYRPDLAVFDDIEEDEAMKTQARRDKIDNWFRGVMMPALGKNSVKVLSGSLLHKDGIMARIGEELKNGKRKGKLLEYPLYKTRMEDNLWKSKYPTRESILAKKRDVGKETIWQREYLLKIIAEEGQIVTWEDIKWYDKIPEKAKIVRQVIAVDLAISQKDTADFTAIVVLSLTRERGKYKIYVEDYSKKRTGFKETLEDIDKIHDRFPDSIVLIEDKSYQKAAIETLQYQTNYSVQPISFKGDKRSRLETVSPSIKKGKVYFKKNQRPVINEVVGLGVEKHDDLCDALVYGLYDLRKHMTNQSMTKGGKKKGSNITTGLLNKKF